MGTSASSQRRYLVIAWIALMNEMREHEPDSASWNSLVESCRVLAATIRKLPGGDHIMDDLESSYNRIRPA